MQNFQYTFETCKQSFISTYLICITIPLINFFIPLRWVEAISCENFLSAKWDPGSTKEGSCLARMNFLCVIVGYNF